jgi:hypothetical protein
MKNHIKEAIYIIEEVRKTMPECTNKAFLNGALNELNEALSPTECVDATNDKLPELKMSKENRIRRIELYSSVYALFLTKLPPKKLFDRFFDYSFETGGDGFTDMQEFVTSNLKKEFYWSTGIGIIEAIDHIVEEAISNGNIQKF